MQNLENSSFNGKIELTYKEIKRRLEVQLSVEDFEFGLSLLKSFYLKLDFELQQIQIANKSIEPKYTKGIKGKIPPIRIKTVQETEFSISVNQFKYCWSIFFIGLKTHLNKLNNKYKYQKDFYEKCFVTLNIIYELFEKEYYCFYFDVYRINKVDLAKCFSDYYLLANNRGIIDENHLEVKKLEVEFLEILYKTSDYCLENETLEMNSIKIDVPREIFTERENNLNKLMTYRDDYKVNFYPYNGKLVNDVINDTPKQFLNLLINLTHFSVKEELMLNEKLIQCNNFTEALFANRIKQVYLLKKAREMEEMEERSRIQEEKLRDRDLF
jgi:hypothetical protein